MHISDEFRLEYYLHPDQINELDLYYKKNPKYQRQHMNYFKKMFSEDKMMGFVNKTFISHLNLETRSGNLSIVKMNNIKYYVVLRGNGLALWNVETNEAYIYNLITWKASSVRIWKSNNITYKKDYQIIDWFALWKDCKGLWDGLDLLKEIPEFKYIDFSKLKTFNFYYLFNQRLEKDKLWQIEMLIKSSYIELAEQLTFRYEKLDWNIFKKYLDFFKKKGKSWNHYIAILYLIKNGFEDPEFMYLDSYIRREYDEYDWFIKFCKNNPGFKRDRFLKYIKNRKGSKTQFGVKFLFLYKIYLEEIRRLRFDLTKDKYAFPVDLMKTMEEYLLTVDIYDEKTSRQFRLLYEGWQRNLPVDQQDERFLSREIRIAKENNKKIAAAKRAAKLKEKNLKELFEFNKKIRYEISDNLVLIAPLTTDDLLIEGKTLNHCVYSYKDQLSKKDTNVLFLRKKDYLDKPYYTIEIKNNEVLQCRTTNNQVSAEITELVKNWYQTHQNEIQLFA